MEAFDSKPPAEVDEVLSSVLRLVIKPTEANRRATQETARKAGPNTLVGCLASAAFFSGGSVSLPGLPAVAPRPFVTGRLVGVAVYLAAVKLDAANYKHKLRRFLALGLEVARGNNLWYADRQLHPVRLDPADRRHFLSGLHRKTKARPPQNHSRPKPDVHPKPHTDKDRESQAAPGDRRPTNETKKP